MVHMLNVFDYYLHVLTYLVYHEILMLQRVFHWFELIDHQLEYLAKKKSIYLKFIAREIYLWYYTWSADPCGWTLCTQVPLSCCVNVKPNEPFWSLKWK